MSTIKMLIGLCVLSGAVYTQAAQMVYDANDEFSLASNPNGVWTYGYSDFATVRDGTTKYVFSTNWTSRGANVDSWQQSNAVTDPAVTHNASGAPVTAFSFTWGVNDIGLDSYGGNTIIQWTAPRAGTVVANAIFGASPADVYEGFNGVPLKGAQNGGGTTWSDTFTVQAGDSISFAAVTADQGTVTMFRETVTYQVVPEPSAAVLAVMGAISLVAARRKRTTAAV